ncbi:MAG: DUF1499 domain-containing protein [Cohaesibacter sp.]|jgi:uncharacterized membrane protein (DUF485 family)|nr:DUF1499 domain-containing protein [Cohaesibacter sp.]
MSGHYSFIISKPAKWALWLARLSIPVALISFLMLRFGGMHPSIVVFCFATAIILALLSLLVSLIAFPSIWVDGHKGGRRLWGAFLRGLVVLVPALVLVYFYVSRPAFSDLSTNPANPPLFEAAWQAREDGDNLLDIGSEESRNEQAAAYPELESHSVDQSPVLMFLVLKDLVTEAGWSILGEVVPSEDKPEGMLEATGTNIFTGLRYAVVLRIQDNGNEGTLLDMRSASLWGPHDLGQNARRIKGFFGQVDEKLRQSTKLYELKLEELERQERLKRGPLPRRKPKIPPKSNQKKSKKQTSTG